jgi:ferrochelatase
VSEHSETLVELDMDYAKVAEEAGVPDYLRVRTVGVRPAFIGALAQLVSLAVQEKLCPAAFKRCGFREVRP